MLFTKKLWALIIVVQAQLIDAKEIIIRLEKDSNTPIVNAKLIVRQTSQTAITDQNGQVTLTLDTGTYQVDIEAGHRGHYHESLTVSDANNDIIVLSIGRHLDQKVVITANPLEHTSLDMAAPAILLSGEQLVLNRSSTIGEILKDTPGISLSSFGPSVARPVIRGLSGKRVKITSNQMSVQDASTTSADHDVGIEPLLAEQIEVIKGPATLLYGSNAVGGVINVTDRKINPNGINEKVGALELRLGDSATRERSVVIGYDAGFDEFVFHVDAFGNEFSDILIPVNAESHALHESEGHDDTDEDTEPNKKQRLHNSFSESKGGSIGTTWVSDFGFVGVSINAIDKIYGIPVHGSHEEENKQSQDDDSVSIDMHQTRFDIQSEIKQPTDFFEKLFIGISSTDYRHTEYEGAEAGTIFKNKGKEIRSHLKHAQWFAWSGVLGIQLDNREFSAIGDEAFVPPSETSSEALFIIEEKRLGDFKIELGGRLETTKIKAEGFDTKSHTAASYSTGFVWTLAEKNKIAMNYSHASSIPTAEELFSFGAHPSTQTFEIGNENLKPESSKNIDLSFRFNNERFDGEFNLFYNQFDDFIFAEPKSISDISLPSEAITEATEHDLQIVHYQQRDARISGIELAINIPLINNQDYELTWGISADMVEAEFSDGNYIPRMPPVKLSTQWHLDIGAFSSTLHWSHGRSQSHTFSGPQAELPTKSYDLIDLEAAYRMPIESNEMFLFLKFKNLLDEEIRDHSSFLKDRVPRVARNLNMGVRLQF